MLKKDKNNKEDLIDLGTRCEQSLTSEINKIIEIKRNREKNKGK